MDGVFLDWALEAFSGSVAVDELYEGPYCVLSAVDNRQYKRILYEVLDHDPSHEDIEPFLRRLKRVLEERELTLYGVTTDGSSLYPKPIREVFGDVAHQICTFHVIRDLIQGVLRAVAKERKRLARAKPKLKRGRPSFKDKEARRLARQSKYIQEKISVASSRANASACGSSRGAYRSCASCVRSWTTFMPCLTGVVVRKRH